MTLQEKVGQMSAVLVYGNNATEPSAADAGANEAMYGPDAPTGATVAAKHRVGGIIYFTGTHHISNPQ